MLCSLSVVANYRQLSTFYSLLIFYQYQLYLFRTLRIVEECKIPRVWLAVSALGTKGNERDQKGLKGNKRERKGAKGIVPSNYVRGILGPTTEYAGGRMGGCRMVYSYFRTGHWLKVSVVVRVTSLNFLPSALVRVLSTNHLSF